jgi:hypothetical protein
MPPAVHFQARTPFSTSSLVNNERRSFHLLNACDLDTSIAPFAFAPTRHTLHT